jgi:hypothetical protein
MRCATFRGRTESVAVGGVSACREPAQLSCRTRLIKQKPLQGHRIQSVAFSLLHQSSSKR